MILNLGGEFINYEGEEVDGETMLLLCARGFGRGPNSHTIKLLLDRGARVTARDSEGWTCLHYALDSIRDPGNVSEKGSLLLMIKAGADVYATDHYGKSVSDVAYNSHLYDKIFNLGTYRGDLWDEVLTECGYDAAWFREEFRRREDSRRRHPAYYHRLVQELRQAFNIDERNPTTEEQNPEIGGQDLGNNEESSNVVMRDAGIYRNSSSPQETVSNCLG